MSADAPAYGLWSLVVINSAVFLAFAFSFTKPNTSREWRSFGAFSAFIVALFVEMYGYPLTVYLLSGWLIAHYPHIDPLSHGAGHLWSTLLGWKGDPHVNPLHFLSGFFVGGGFLLIGAAWPVLYRARETSRLAITGPYATIRHPQYVGFIAIMVGFLLQWPTLITLVMFPVLVIMYVRLARREELELRDRFGLAYALYAAQTPGFLPRLRRHAGGSPPLTSTTGSP